jgi:hypothetical protein
MCIKISDDGQITAYRGALKCATKRVVCGKAVVENISPATFISSLPLLMVRVLRHVKIL